MADIGAEFPAVQSFFAEKEAATVKILTATKNAVGGGAVFEPEAVRRNFRLADYYSRPKASVAPRCGEHRDFGVFTLIFPDDSGSGAGLQVKRKESRVAYAL